MLKELKQLLVGEEFVEDEYESDLNYILGQNGMELNSVDFDYDRIYNKGYLYNEDWSINFVASIEKEYFEKEIENNGMKHVIDKLKKFIYFQNLIDKHIKNKYNISIITNKK